MAGTVGTARKEQTAIDESHISAAATKEVERNHAEAKEPYARSANSRTISTGSIQSRDRSQAQCLAAYSQPYRRP